MEYREDGTGTNYYKVGGTVHEAGGGWSMNNTTGEVRSTSEDGQTSKIMHTITFEDDNTYFTLYTECYDPATGQIVETGEFKDVYVRSQE